MYVVLNLAWISQVSALASFDVNPSLHANQIGRMGGGGGENDIEMVAFDTPIVYEASNEARNLRELTCSLTDTQEPKQYKQPATPPTMMAPHG